MTPFSVQRVKKELGRVGRFILHFYQRIGKHLLQKVRCSFQFSQPVAEFHSVLGSGVVQKHKGYLDSQLRLITI